MVCVTIVPTIIPADVDATAAVTIWPSGLAGTVSVLLLSAAFTAKLATAPRARAGKKIGFNGFFVTALNSANRLGESELYHVAKRAPHAKVRSPRQNPIKQPPP